MILTELERKIMIKGNPPHLQASTRKRIDLYTEEEKKELVRFYIASRKSYQFAANRCGWSNHTAYRYLRDQGVLRKRKHIPDERYVLVRKLLAEGYSTPGIAKHTGWTPRYVRSLRENLRKREYAEKI